MYNTLLNSKYQLRIPKQLREKYGFKPGIKINFEETKNGLLLKPFDKYYFLQFQGMSKNLPSKQEWLEYKKEERELEENKMNRIFKQK